MTKLEELREAVNYHLPPDGGEPPDLDLNVAVWALARVQMLLDLIDAIDDPECKLMMNEAFAEMLEAGGFDI